MYCIATLVIFFFFFQAEDGIRDVAVTGVQTCALPIFGPAASRTCRWVLSRLIHTMLSPHMMASTGYGCRANDSASELGTSVPGKKRSEEHTSELQSRLHLVCRLLLEKKKELRSPTMCNAIKLANIVLLAHV